MNYSHTQKGPLGWLLVVIAIGLGFLAWPLWHTPPAPVILTLTGAALLVVAPAFWHLTVEDGGEHLLVRYGPLSLLMLRIRYASITAVEVGRSSFIDGWGVHYVPGRGWTFNISGRDCVVIRRGGGTLRVGTDDAPGLARFLSTKLGHGEPEKG